MYTWPYKVTALRSSEILRAIQNDGWQEFRKSLKGLATNNKLRHLAERRRRLENEGRWNRTEEVRIDNYINALLRGGQLRQIGAQIVAVR